MNKYTVIRRLEHKDIIQIIKIEQTVFTDPWSEQSFFKALNNKSDIYLVAADEDDKILGYCGLWGVSGEGQITNVCIHPEYQRKGIGETILAALIDEGRKAGLNSFTLEVRVNNYAAIKLYKKIGFEEAGIRKNFYSHPKEDALIMWMYNNSQT